MITHCCLVYCNIKYLLFFDPLSSYRDLYKAQAQEKIIQEREKHKLNNERDINKKRFQLFHLLHIYITNIYNYNIKLFIYLFIYLKRKSKYCFVFNYSFTFLQ